MNSAIALLMLACTPPGGEALPVERLVLPSVQITQAPIGRLSEGHFVVQNIGTAPSTFVLSATAPFRASDQPVDVAAGAEVEVAFEFVPDSYDDASGQITVTTEHHVYATDVTGTVNRDLDGDGFQPPEVGGTDCDDEDALLNPDQPEKCDGVDEDCDGSVDEEPIDGLTWYLDGDGDGFGSTTTVSECALPDGYTTNFDDCDDTRADVYPGAPDAWYDSVDADCAGDSDHDQDLDGFLAASGGGSDCDDTDADVFPGAADAWYDGVDGNCDGASDYDQDGDGADSDAFGGTDCDDLDTSYGPSAPELDDGLDQDCDGRIDETFVLPGHLVFTELYVATTGDDPLLQYVELRNVSVRTVRLVGAEIVSAAGAIELGSVSIGPGQSALFCGSTATADNGGLLCEWELPGPLTSSDQAAIWLERDIDMVDWSTWTAPAEGNAWMLTESALDADANDIPSNWCEDLGQPGSWPKVCP